MNPAQQTEKKALDKILGFHCAWLQHIIYHSLLERNWEKKKTMKLSSASSESKYSRVHLQPSVSSTDCQTAEWRDKRHINSKHTIWRKAGQRLPPLQNFCLLLLLKLLLLRAMLTNKNVTEEITLWSDSINNKRRLILPSPQPAF